ncbi:hypothetical protein [Micromonospora endophytica]|uniref:Uncharacterized protein n=1 Tax=Micromonospora endophytica TaxID=515350 RepID=A0A2W2CF79_9ACTN|nr:hypothetical protein [Micromonospora endophytica]PZF96440.1 hypothetical protein C1I93_13845 [Micromonospora endophytica]RIW49944.1 hypothetical protein D3H59_04120 [Micromonospora endophytica]BCJ57100.1 hypothetical protein Jiend_05220 [Micromonospora endophytica]
MDFWDLTKLLIRRWYVAGPLLLLTIGATLFAAVTIEPNHVATSYVQLVPPSVTPKESDGRAHRPRNPWLDLGLPSLAKAAILTVQDQRVVEGLKDAGFTDTFTLTLDQALPIVTFEVIAPTKEQASATTQELVRHFDESVARLQTDYGAAAEQTITTLRLTIGENVTESTSKVKRALVAIAAVGILLTTALTVLLDAVIRRRRARREEGSRPAPTSGMVYGPPASEPMRPWQARRSEPDPARGRHDDPALEPVPADATIIVPRPEWPLRDAEGNRR